MSEIAIRVQGVSKKYRLRRGWYFSIRDEIPRLAHRLWGGASAPRDEFWALREVSFDVRRGETVGLIGANGSGKSTMLKILSRVTVPTAGEFAAYGKIGALIEVGAGFHPDLTGRENVYLNGAILGMRRAEIEAKFERIVRFAEVAEFIDTPIKYYSSGMMVRLGFSVAAHVDPEILLVDEVLAVGDLAFQAKCLNKLAELRDEDKTCILVSHAMPNILRHSDRVLWIDQGQVRRFGDPEAVVEEYLRSVQTRVAADGAPPRERPDSGIVIREVTIRNREGASAHVLEYGQPATVEVVYHIDRPVSDPVVAVTFEDVRGAALGGLTSRLDGAKLDTRREDGVARLILSPVVFTRGAYTVTVAILDENIQRYLDVRHAATTFMVEGPGVSSREVSGHVVYPHRWEIEAAEE